MKGPKPEGFSGGQFCFGVETLHDTAGKLSFGPEPVKKQGPMSTRHLGHLLYRFNLRSHRLTALSVQKPDCPVRRGVAPELLELLLQQVALGLTGTHIVQCLAKMHHDVEAVEHVHGLTGFLLADGCLQPPTSQASSRDEPPKLLTPALNPRPLACAYPESTHKFCRGVKYLDIAIVSKNLGYFG